MTSLELVQTIAHVEIKTSVDCCVARVAELKKRKARISEPKTMEIGDL